MKNERVQRRKAPISLISLGLIAVSLIIMLILCLVPGAAKNSKNPVLVIIGVESNNLPSLALKNTLHAAGFEYEVQDYGHDLPNYGNIVVVGVGEQALSVVNEYKDNENVSGFILICPTLNEEYMTGLTSGNPSCDIAIFAGRDNSKTPAEMGDARLIYERLSGDDTIFGIPIQRGGLFASKVYVDNGQNRMLSLSAFPVRDPAKLFFSPLFQNELAGYLSVTYIDEATRETSFGRINSWFVLSWISIALGVISLLLFLSNLGLSATGNDVKKAPISKWVFGLIGGISIALALIIVASSFLDMLESSILMILALIPELFMLCLFIINFSWITTKDGKFVPKKAGMIQAVFLAVIIGLFVMYTLSLTTDLRVHKITDPGISSGLLTLLLIFDVVLSTGLIYASRKSSTAGQGAKNCFGNRLIIGLMFIPCAAALIFGMFPLNSHIFYSGLAGLCATGIPYLAVMPLVKHTDRSLIPGVLHGIIYVLVLAAVL